MRKITAEVVADSINPAGGRITSFLTVQPRYALAEFNTHRVFTRNAASSRAIPVKKLLEQCKNDPVLPWIWGKNQKGMQSYDRLTSEESARAEAVWRRLAQQAAEGAEELSNIGLHKQWANRPMEAFMSVAVLVTATNFGNFFNLRAHSAALPDFGQLAYTMLKAFSESKPKPLQWGEWHLPFADRLLEPGTPQEDNLRIITARCARLSYMTYDGIFDPQSDFRLHDDLKTAGHWSPFEHPAKAEPEAPEAWTQLQEYLAYTMRMNANVERWVSELQGKVREDHGNFRGGWRQYRKTFKGENREQFDPLALISQAPDWIEL